MQEPQANTNIYDLRLWKRFWDISKMYWFSEEKWKARGILALLLLLLGAFSSIGILFSYVNRDMMTALSEKNLPEFYHSLLLNAGAIVVAAPVVALFQYVQQKMAINWRMWLSGYFMGKYFANRAYYHVNNDTGIDNPDQRISDDLHSLTHNNLAILMMVFNALVQFFAFAGILWSISIKLVLVLLLYAVFGTVISTFLGKRLLNLNFQQTRLNADFRYGLIHIRDNAESIAFYRGEEREKSQVIERLRAAINNNLLLVSWERNLAFFTNAYNYIPGLLPFVLLGPQYFSGQIKLGVLTQAVGAFGAVLSALAVLVTNFSTLSTIAAVANRLETFATRLDQPMDAGSTDGSSTIKSIEEPRMALANVTLQTPNYLHTLIKDVTAEIPQGSGLLIAGPSGAGKSSLLRAVAGLWNAGEGQISRPPLHDMLFLPQRPYMVLGSLREQLLYPGQNMTLSEDELRAVLKKVNLADLSEKHGGFDAVLGWGTLLSLGEQQRLAFARLLLAKPSYAVLDEATSALDVANEAHLYGLLKETETTFVSVGHRPTLLDYHDNVLELQGSGTWRLVPTAGFMIAPFNISSAGK